MATKSEIRAYANRNSVSMAQAKAYFINKAKQANVGEDCQLLILKRDSRDGSVEFMHGLVSIPKNAKVARNDAIGSLGIEWGHDGKILCMVSEYLSHSPTLDMARMGILGADSCVSGAAGVGKIDLNNLGCFIEFDVDARGVYTKGPLWMDPSDVNVKADQIAKKYAGSHDIKYHTAA
jgi:hypothetical protein